ncbi:hypothetical protein [Lentzea sp. NPDC004782]|uniref:hypothetical protein n=1 Tax=Lentzea sp. NPDC004782 TaxID=3154458 RepID=UPI0033A6DD6E
MKRQIGITKISLATGFGTDTEQTWKSIVDGATAVHGTDDFESAYVSKLADRDVVTQFMSGISSHLPADAGVVIGTNGAPEAAWLSGAPYRLLDDVVAALGVHGPTAVFGTGCTGALRTKPRR